MTLYSLVARVDQIVTKEVQLLIEAADEEEAQKKARDVLGVYPEPIPYDPMVHRIVTMKAHYWIPKSIEFIALKEEPDEAA